MPNLSAQIPHQLTRAEAKQRLQDQLSALRQQGSNIADVRETWTGDTMNFSLLAMGNSINGQMRIDDHFVYVDVAVPWFLSMIAGAVKQQIEQKVSLSLAGPSDKDSPRKMT
jgi:putative polyhydroxyalkanoate system protein